MIALGPTYLSTHGMYLGAKNSKSDSQTVAMTIEDTKPATPIVVARRTAPKAATIMMAKPLMAKSKAKPISVVKHVARKVLAKKTPAFVAAKKPMKKPAQKIAPKPIAVIAQKPVVKNPAAAPAPLGSPTSTIKVTQNYLGLRQLPGNKPPAYTEQMRLDHMQGSGQLVYFVNKNGTVSDIRLTKSTGYPELDQAAIQAFSKYRFYPGQEGYTVHNFEFVLQGPAVTVGGGLRTTMNGN